MLVSLVGSNKPCCRGKRSCERPSWRAARFPKRLCYVAATLCVLVIYLLRCAHLWSLSRFLRDPWRGTACWSPDIQRKAGATPCQDVSVPGMVPEAKVRRCRCTEQVQIQPFLLMFCEHLSELHQAVLHDVRSCVLLTSGDGQCRHVFLAPTLSL